MKLPRFLSKAVLALSALVLIGGLWSANVFTSREDSKQDAAQLETAEHGSDEAHAAGNVVWTCSMHPQIQLPQPGKCPLCFMDLIKLEIDANKAAAESYRQIELDSNARKLAEIEVSPVTRQSASTNLRMVGKVDYDESLVGTISAWTAGRIDRLHIAKTGSFVRKGQPMAAIYSPELYAAQAELIQAIVAQNKLKPNSSSLIRTSIASNISAAKEKLHLLGLSKGQISSIAKQSTPSKNITLRAPQSGIVIRKDVVEGSYVKTGQSIYSIADLSAVWVVLEAYETDLAWIKEGDIVDFSTDAFAGEEFKGRIVYIDPVVNPQTRTVAVRLEVKNPEGKLKPGMFVQAAQKTGVNNAPDAELPLVIPVSAPLLTGKRAIVYVQVAEKEGVYEGREIVLGPKSGNMYIVKSGLAEGELVVSKGSFKLDSALQIMAKPSMMSDTTSGSHEHSGMAKSEGDTGASLEVSPLIVSKLHFLNKDFEALARALQQKDVKQGRELFTRIGKKFGAIETFLLEGDAKLVWKENGMLLSNDCILGAEADSYKRQHEIFALAKNHYDALRSAFGVQKAATSLTPSIQVPDEFKAQLGKVVVAYVAVSEALGKDSPDAAKQAVKPFVAALNAVSETGLSEEAKAFWKLQKKEFAKGITAIRNAADISAMRKGFFLVSNALLKTTKAMGIVLKGELYEVHCPMAFDNKGASWIQRDEGIRNPYFGATMYMCGEVKRQLAVE